MVEPGMPSAVEPATRQSHQSPDRSAAATVVAEAALTNGSEDVLLVLNRLPPCELCGDWGRLDDIPCPRCA